VPLVVLAGDGPLAADLRAAGVEVHVRSLAVLRRGLLGARGAVAVGRALGADVRALRRLVRGRDVALVHSNTSVTLGGAAAARLAGIPHVWHVREIYTGFERAWPVYARVLRSADALPCVSEATRAQLADAPQAVVLHDGLALTPVRAPREQARAALGLPAGAFVVAVLGRISPWKGQELLVRALALVPGAVAVVAGDAWPGEEHRVAALTGLAARLGVSDRLRMLGFRDDVGTVLGAADVVAVPSTQPDPLPNAALEATAAGCCVVAAAHGGLPEIVRDGVTGRLVEPGDAGALARALRELAADPAVRERLGAAAAADVGVRFAPALALERTQALYDRVLASRR
jgi:glycosyltransferase involved in cell wall biosynthesis